MKTIVLALLCGCAPGGAEWNIAFESTAASASAVSIEAYVLKDRCETGRPVASFVSTKESPGGGSELALVPGAYGLEAQALDALCERVASGCESVDLPLSADAQVTLASDSGYGCPGRTCEAGSCGTGPGRRECSRGAALPALVVGATSACALSSGCAPLCWDLIELVSEPVSSSRAQTITLSTDVPCFLLDDGTSSCAPELRAAISFASNDIQHCSVSADGSLGCAPASGGAAVLFASDIQYSMVFLGDDHACATSDSGDLYCWGANDSGQLGRAGASVDQPTLTSDQECWTTAAAGDAHTCAVTCDGKLFCWGDNGVGQLGQGTSADGSIMQVGSLNDWRVLAAGSAHTCAVRSDGSLFCWGRGQEGQLGAGISSDASTPTQVGTSGSWRTVAASGNNTCALGVDDSLFCWGEASNSLLPKPVN